MKEGISFLFFEWCSVEWIWGKWKSKCQGISDGNRNEFSFDVFDGGCRMLRFRRVRERERGESEKRNENSTCHINCSVESVSLSLILTNNSRSNVISANGKSVFCERCHQYSLQPFIIHHLSILQARDMRHERD